MFGGTDPVDHQAQACLYASLARSAGNKDAAQDRDLSVHHLHLEIRALKQMQQELAQLREETGRALLDAVLDKSEGTEHAQKQAQYDKKLADFRARSQSALKLCKQLEGFAKEDYAAALQGMEEKSITRLPDQANDFYDADKVRKDALALKGAYAKAAEAHKHYADLIKARQQAVAEFSKTTKDEFQAFVSDAVDRGELTDLARLRDSTRERLQSAKKQVQAVRDKMTRRLQVAEREAEEEPSDAAAQNRLKRVREEIAKVNEMLGPRSGPLTLDQVIEATTRQQQNRDPFSLPD